MKNALEEKLQEAVARFNARDLAGSATACEEVLDRAPNHPHALHLLGVVRLMNGNPREAASLIGRALGSSPHDAAMLENRGVARLAMHDYRSAEADFRRALEFGAAHGLLHMRLGLALGSQGKLTEAVSALRTAVASAPGDPDVYLNLGNALAESGQADEALACFRKVLALQPRHAIAHFNIGTLLRRLGRFDEALAALNSALAAAPEEADVHLNLGSVYEEMGRREDAAAHYRRALALNPRHAQAHNNLGHLLRSQGQDEEAVACFNKALEIDPNHADACINLGNVRAEQGRYAEAQTLYEKALRASPHSYEAHYNLGRLFKRQGRLKDAITHFREALARAPGRAVIHNDLGSAYLQAGDLEAATACYRKAIEADTGAAYARYNLAETLKLQGRLDEAMRLYEEALAIQPDYIRALNGLTHMRQHVCQWEGIEDLWARLRRDMESTPEAQVSPFSILSQPTSPQEQLACARAWAERELAPLAAARPRLGFDFSARRRPSGKLRIGYLSWDFHKHATSYLIAELFDLHDRERFEIHAYSYGPDDGSAIRARIRGACDRFIDVANQSYIATSQRIYDDGVDILIDLKGYTQGARWQILALRPAPIQVNWLGYPGTMGADCIDYIIADPFIIPEGMERCYSEKVVRLADCYQINDRRREISDRTPTREECGLPARGLVFCCFNLAYKILPDVFGWWMRIMQAVPDSVLWLLETNPWAAGNLKRAAAAKGVAPERLVFAPRLPLAEHLARYRLADLALDTFPYTSHTTASDALWVGCPLVTCVGETFASRVAGSILVNAGMRELVTESFEACEHLVLDLAASPAKLRDLRRRLQEGRDSCPLFDTPRFAKNLERAYEQMFDAYEAREMTAPQTCPSGSE
jgi:predicted O-linked N-acetylglucosamine transferase (SPINDLY family)